METIMEDEEYNDREARVPPQVPVVAESDLERERRRGRDIIVAIDHGPNSKHAFHWALIHLCRPPDTIHLVHAVSDVKNQVVYDLTEELMEKLTVEAYKVAMVKTVARIVEGDPGKVICKEVERIKPVAVVMGTRGRSLIQCVLQGSVGEYCLHHCKAAPVVIVPGKAVFNKEEDIATYTFKAVDDQRTLNKSLYIRPQANTLSFNDMVSLWEKKIGKTLERSYVPEEKLLKQIQESSPPWNVILSINHSAYVKGDHTNFEIEPSFGVEDSAFYPDVKYATVVEFLNQFV